MCRPRTRCGASRPDRLERRSPASSASDEGGHGETTLVVDPAHLVEACTHLRDEEGFNFLSDVSPADYLGWGEQRRLGIHRDRRPGRDLNLPMTQGLQTLPEPKPKRFSVSYHLLAVGDEPRRVRVQTWVDDGEPVPSVIEVWPTADWHEREAWDMMGIPIEGHPNLKRILMRRRLGGAPAAQGLPDRRRAGPLLGGGVVAVAPERTRAAIYEGTRIPRPIPTVLQVSEELRGDGRRPADQLRAEPSVDARGAAPDRRPLRRGRRRPRGRHRLPAHRLREEHGAEDAGGRRSRTRERIDYLSFQDNELVFVLAIEKLLELETPEKADVDAHAASAS